jgi:pyrroloquinoline quinone biosynthesis protein B
MALPRSGLQILVLGSAAGGGFPQWNCNCGACRRARSGASDALARTQSSLAVSVDGERWVLLNASPDLRLQIEANQVLHPRLAPRHSPIEAVLLSNADIDHVAGLLSLRESHPFALYGTARVLAILANNSVFNVLAAGTVARRELQLDEEAEIRTSEGTPLGLCVRTFAVPGKIALYLEKSSEPNFGGQAADTVGFEISAANGKSFFYIPGTAGVPAGLAARLQGAQLVFFDGTLWRDEEMIEAGLTQKSGLRMGHISLSGPQGSLAVFAPLSVKRKIFIHINNTNPILIEGTPERLATESAGWEVAFDGMRVEL